MRDLVHHNWRDETMLIIMGADERYEPEWWYLTSLSNPDHVTHEELIDA